MDKYEQRRSALKKLVDSLGHGSIAAIAAKAGIDANYVSRMLYEPGKAGRKRIGENSWDRLVSAYPNLSTPSARHSLQIRAYEVRGIDGEDGVDPETDVLIDEVDILLSGGHGNIVPEFIETTYRMPFQMDWFRRMRTKPKDVKLMRVHGDSMERTLFDGDRVMVNFTDTRVRDGKVYAVAIGNEAKVKRLYSTRDGGLRIVSDNQAIDGQGSRLYPDDLVPPHEMDTVQVLGRVIDKSGSGGL